MLSQNLFSCAASISVLAGRVSAAQWAFLQLLQDTLLDQARQARQLEERLPLPTPDTCRIIRLPDKNAI